MHACLSVCLLVSAGFEGFVDPRADYEYPAVVWQQLIGFFTALMTTPYAAITRHPVADLHLYEWKVT